MVGRRASRLPLAARPAKPRIDRRGRHASPPWFTLIELLVVISIVALLVALLLPALQGAKRLAKQTVCATQEDQIAFAALSYANENADWLPPLTTDPVNHANFNHWSWFLYAPSTLPGYHNMGLLWKDGSLTEERVMFCPSIGRGERYGYEAALDDWPDGRFDQATDPDGFVETSYTFNPWLEALGAFRRYDRHGQMPSDALLLTDVIARGKHTSHRDSHLWNVTLADGSTRRSIDESLISDELFDAPVDYLNKDRLAWERILMRLEEGR